MPAHCAALGAGAELVVLILEQDVERGERAVTARDILLQVKLVRIAQFVARVHLLLENSQVIPNHDDFVEECLERDFFRLKRTIRRLHNERAALPSSRQTFYQRVLLFQSKSLDHSVSSIADQVCEWYLHLAQGSGRFRRLEIARGRRNCPLLVVKRDLGGLSGQRFHHPDAVLRMAHLHTDMERVDIHVALKVCEIVTESATIVNWRRSKSRVSSQVNI